MSRRTDEIRAMLGIVCLSADAFEIPHLTKWYDRLIDPRASLAVREDAFRMGTREAPAQCAATVAKIRGLLNELNDAEAISLGCAAMGRARSVRKAAASRENGKKGGRPRKTAQN